MIAAVSENNVIGLDGEIPWYIPEDMVRFRNLTLGHPVIMGRKTYESLPNNVRPLPRRKNIVVSSKLEETIDIRVVDSPEEVFRLIRSDEKSYVIGGESIYDSFLPYANELEITRVHRKYEGDTFFPNVDWSKWELFNEESHVSSEIPYSFLTYKRKDK